MAEGRYGSTSDYVRDLVRRDQDDAEKLRVLKAAIDDGLASGVSERDPFECIAELRDDLQQRVEMADAAELSRGEQANLDDIHD